MAAPRHPSPQLWVGFVSVTGHGLGCKVSSQQPRGALGELMSEQEAQEGDPRQLATSLSDNRVNRTWNPVTRK